MAVALPLADRSRVNKARAKLKLRPNGSLCPLMSPSHSSIDVVCASS